MKKYLLLSGIYLLAMTACKKEITPLSAENSFITFRLSSINNTGELSADITCVMNDTLIEAVTGDTSSRTHMVATFTTTTGASVSVNGVQQVSGKTENDFSHKVMYAITAPNGLKKYYTVKIRALTGLPIISIKTDAPVVSRDYYVNGSMKIDGNIDFIEGLYEGNIQIKGRGNSTWFQEKKPYKIKLPAKSGIMGMPADKEWALLANYLDKTLLRNDVALELSERLQLDWTPRRRFVELFLNDEYMGNFLLTETVKTATDRLNIPLMDSKDGLDTLNGCLVEADQTLDGLQWFRTTATVPIVIKEPSPLSDYQLNFIHRRFQRMEDGMNNLTDLRDQIDLDSWIKWVIVNEVMRNRDAILYSSCFLYLDHSKIHMGPVWDFDLSSGGYEGNVPEGWYVQTGSWIGVLLNHPYYRARFKEIWLQNYASIKAITEYVHDKNQYLQFSQKKNFERWDIMNATAYESQLIFGSYAKEIEHLSDFLTKRVNWINAQVSGW